MDENADPDENQAEAPSGESEQNKEVEMTSSSMKEVPPQERTVTLLSLTDQITCGLCKGYLVDAQTVTDCVHSYCRSCIVKYLGTSDCCPRCGNKIYTTLPLLNLRADRQIQTLVYSIVPSLFKDEMLKRRDFYQACPPPGFKLTADQQVSLCLRLCDRYPPYENIKEKDLCVDKRFLLCPASFTVNLLEKFVRLKFNLGPKFKIELFCANELLYTDYTLMDVALVFGWRAKKPLLINYVVNDTTYTSLKKLQMVENKGIIHKGERRGSCTSTTTSTTVNNDSFADTQSVNQTVSIETNNAKAAKSKKRKSSQCENEVPVDQYCAGPSGLFKQDLQKLEVRPPGVKRGPGRPPKRPPVGVIAHQAQRKIIKKLQQHTHKVVVIDKLPTESDLIGNIMSESILTEQVHSQSETCIISEVSNSLPVSSEDNHEDMSEELENNVVDLSSGFSNSVQNQLELKTNIVDNQNKCVDKNSNTDAGFVDTSMVNSLDIAQMDKSLTEETVENVDTNCMDSSGNNDPVKSKEISDIEMESKAGVRIINIQPISSPDNHLRQQSLHQSSVFTSPTSVPQSLSMLGGYQMLPGNSSGSMVTGAVNSATVVTAVPRQVSANGTVISVLPQHVAQGGVAYQGTNIIHNTSQQQLTTSHLQPRVITGPYNVGYLPFHSTIPKIKRKRGRPPKNRSVGFGRCSPMPHTLGLPGSPLYTLVKRGRGRPPKRKVGLPPVFVVPQGNDSSRVFVQNIPANQNVTFVNNVGGLQFSGGAVIQPQPNVNTQVQQQPFHSINTQIPQPNPMTKTEKFDNHEDKSIVKDGVESDKQIETDCEDTSLISQDVVGNIIDKLSDEKGMDTPPPVTNKDNNGCSNTVYIGQSQGQIVQQGQIMQHVQGHAISQGHIINQGQVYQVQGNHSNKSSPIMVIPQSNSRGNHTIILPQSKQQVSPYEKQFENFVHQQKFQSNVRGQLVYNMASENSPGSNMIVLNSTKHLDTHSASKNMGVDPQQGYISAISMGCSVSQTGLSNNGIQSQSAISNVLPVSVNNGALPVTSVANSGVLPICSIANSGVLPVCSIANGGVMPLQNIPQTTEQHSDLTSSHSIKDSSSNPASPESVVSEGDLSFSSKEGTTPNSKRHSISSSDLKEKKRHNIHKLTEKLYSSLGEKGKRHKSEGGSEHERQDGQMAHNVSNDDLSGVNGDVEMVNGGSQRKTVISAVNDKAFGNKGLYINHQAEPHVQQHQSSMDHLARLVSQGSSLNHNNPLSVNGNFYRHHEPIVSSGLQPQQHHIKQKQLQALNGVYTSGNVTHPNILNKTAMPLPNYKGQQSHQPQPITADNMKSSNNKQSKTKNFALLAQKRKQQAVQRLNNKNKATQQQPFYVGVNVFNCPYIPQGAAVYSDPAVGGQEGFVYKDKADYPGYNNIANNNSDKALEPLDFSIKKK